MVSLPGHLSSLLTLYPLCLHCTLSAHTVPLLPTLQSPDRGTPLLRFSMAPVLTDKKYRLGLSSPTYSLSMRKSCRLKASPRNLVRSCLKTKEVKRERRSGSMEGPLLNMPEALGSIPFKNHSPKSPPGASKKWLSK